MLCLGNAEEEEEMNEMCNWSEGIEERAIARGLAQGMQGMAELLQELGWTEEAIIAKIMEKFSITQEEAESYVRLGK